MLARVVALLALPLLLAAPAAAQWKTVDTFSIKGAHGVIVIPENWNGGLFVYAHGYSADERLLQPIPPDLSLANFSVKLDRLLQATVLPTLFGYASATTTFRSAGWAVKDAIKDIENLRRRFVKTYGKPKHTYLWGHSGGGMVTATVIEYFPDVYDGALPMCGPVAGARRNFDGAFDLRVVFEWVCRDVPGTRFTCRVCTDGRSPCLVDGDCPAPSTCDRPEDPAPPEDGLTPACTEFLLAHPDRFNENPTSPGGGFVEGPLQACFGDLSGRTPPTPEQLERKDRFLRATQIPEDFIATDMFFASIGMAELVHRRTNGRNPWGNVGLTYAAPRLTAEEQAALNRDAYRAAESREAVRYMRRFYEPQARTSSKVLTIHALDDGLVIPENETKYRAAFLAAGRTDQLVQLHTSAGGHCGFIDELFPAVRALTGWVERGEVPSLASVRAACPGCTWTDVTPGPWGAKVIERRQPGAPVASLVCEAGMPGECPRGAACSARANRCRALRRSLTPRTLGPSVGGR